MTTLIILNESRIPKPYTNQSVIGKEAKLRSALSAIDQIILISLPPNHQTLSPESPSLYKIDPKIKIIHTIPWPYYLSALILFIYGFFACLKFKPKWLEAESPIFSGPAVITLGWIFRLKTIIEIRSDFIDLARFRAPRIPLSLKQALVLRLQRFTLTHSSAVIANSRHYAAQFVPRNKACHVINPGINLNLIRKPAYTHNPKMFQLGLIGRLVPEKGSPLLLEAVHLLTQKSNTPPFHLTIAGQGPLLPTLKNQVSFFKLTRSVSFAGFQNNFDFIRRCHLIINPCLYNAPLEMVNAEAASLGIPVICFGSGNYPETVIDQVTGLKVSPPTAKNLAKAISQVLDSQALRFRLHSGGPSFAKTHFSFSKQRQKLLDLYQSHNLF